MKLWNVTYLVWTEEYTTDIPISDWWDKSSKQKPPHSLSHLGITSQPDGTGRGKISLNGRSRSGLCIKDHLIAQERLQILQSQDIVLRWKMIPRERSSGFGDFTFRLRNNEHFTDRAMMVAKLIAEALGLSGKSLTDYLARFQVSQQTRIYVDKKWIGFADYLRKKHDLPALLGTGWSDS